MSDLGPNSAEFRKAVAAPMCTAAAVVSVALSASACSMIDEFNPFGGEKYKMEIEPDVPASKVYDQGLQKLANGAPAEAAKKFTDLGKQYPSSDWARKGLLMTTYAQYQAGDYDSAEPSAERYVKLYPKSPEAPYALYLEASSYYNQIPDISRDQDRAAKALAAFQAVVQNYPNSEYVDDSKFKIAGGRGPARRQGNVDRPLLSQPAQLHRARSTASATCCQSTRPPAIPRRRSIV